jgi:hypothetical protein
MTGAAPSSAEREFQPALLREKRPLPVALYDTLPLFQPALPNESDGDCLPYYVRTVKFQPALPNESDHDRPVTVLHRIAVSTRASKRKRPA